MMMQGWKDFAFCIRCETADTVYYFTYVPGHDEIIGFHDSNV